MSISIKDLNKVYPNGNHALKDINLEIPTGMFGLLGFYVGKMILNCKKNNELIIRNLFIFGTIIMFLGFLLSYGCPINKKLWSSTFVLTTCGFGSLFLALLIWIIDINGKKKWSLFFEIGKSVVAEMSE